MTSDVLWVLAVITGCSLLILIIVELIETLASKLKLRILISDDFENSGNLMAGIFFLMCVHEITPNRPINLCIIALIAILITLILIRTVKRAVKRRRAEQKDQQ